MEDNIETNYIFNISLIIIMMFEKLETEIKKKMKTRKG